MLVNMTPKASAGPLVSGVSYGRVPPVPSADFTVLKVAAHTFKVSGKVTDAGDPVSGATVTAKGHHTKTN
jgi:hypothetical protein